MTATRRLRWGAGLWCVVVMAGACGKKGPPLPPLRPVPVAPTELAVRRVDQRVHLRWLAPKASQDPTVPVSLRRLEIYARTLPDASVTPTPAQLIVKDHLVGTVEMQPPVDPAAPPPQTPTPPDPRPLPGDLVQWSEQIPAGVARPLANLTRDQQASLASRRPVPLLMPPTGVRAMAPRITPPTRYYVVVGVSEHGRRGTPSAIVPLRFLPPPAAPTLGAPTYTESTLTLTWTTPTPGPVLIYSATKAGVEDAAPLTATPLATGTWSTPVVFGEERCFTARRLQRDGPVSIESAAAGPVCVTPVDTYPPAAPGEPRGVAEPGRITVEWDAVTATDLAGYLVLRGDGAGDRLQQLTTTPVVDARYVDATAQVGTSYVYVIVAVDKAGNRSPESTRVTIIGR